MTTLLNGTRLGLRQAEPPEGRAMYPLGTGPGGGDGMNFATGNEVFQWSSLNLNAQQKPSAILGMWVDATAMPAAAGKNIVIKTPNQTFIFAAGNQGYVPITAQAPVVVTVSAQGGATGVLQLILYNYNPLFTGAPGIAAPGGGQGSGGGSSGGGSGSGGGSQGGQLGGGIGGGRGGGPTY